MSNQLKLFLYIVFVAAIFLFIQNRFNIFDVKLLNSTSDLSTNSETSSVKGEDTEVKTVENYVDIVTGANKSVRVSVEIANTEAERKLGLSFRKYLGDYEGMLFVYDITTSNPFWMKDMQIPLDMIFFDSLGFIVDMKESLAPCTENYCPSIYSAKSYKYVLEVNSGFIEKNSIPEGGSLVLHLESVN